MKERPAVIACVILALVIFCTVFARTPEGVEKKRKGSPVEYAVKPKDIIEKIGTKEITATPSIVPTGQMVTLHWKVLPKNPGDVINAEIEVHYEGFNSGKFTSLPKVGQVTICPLGDTKYSLIILLGAEQAKLAEVDVKSPCPVVTITEENMQEIAQSTKPGMAAFDPSITVKDINLKINPSGISISLEAEKRIKNFSNTDVKMDILAYPKIEGSHIKMDIIKCDIWLSSKKRRIIIGVFTIGISEGVLRGFEYYCKNKYGLKVKEEMGKRFNRFLTPKPDNISMIRLSQGKMDIIICKKCQ